MAEYRKEYTEYEETRTKPERSLGGLLADLTNQLTALVRQEMELARVEMTRKVSALSKDIVMMAAGGILAFAGFLVLLAAASYGLAVFLPLWLGTLIVAVVVLAIGGMVFLIGRSRMKKRDMKPNQTIISLKENQRWIKRQT